MRKIIWIAPMLSFGLISSCVTAQPVPDQFRAMTYNIQWFCEDENPDRLSNLRAILSQTKPDIVALQEIQSKAALLQIFPAGQWSIGMLDDPGEFQEVAIAVKFPLKITKTEMLFSSPVLDLAFPGRRDVLRAEVENASGKKAVFYVMHTKSRRGSSATPQGFSGRNETDQQREMAMGMLAGWLGGFPNEFSIVLGDLNDSPDDRSVNILESGNVTAAAGPSNWSNPLMSNLVEQMYRDDYVSIDLSRKFLGDPLPPRVSGAYESNESLRGKPHRFPNDVKVTQALFDQILIRANKADAVVGKAQIFSGVEALRGSNGRVTVTDNPRNVVYTEKGSRASDHLPVYADFAWR